MNVPFFRLCFSCLLLVGAASHLPAQEATAVADLSLPATDEGLPGAGPVRRADWFVDLWQQRRSAFASRAEKERGAVVFLGDSITQGWEDGFRGALAGMKLANRGISGDTTRGMLIRLKKDVMEIDPACVVLLMGTNDIEMDATPKQIADNVELIVGELEDQNANMPIVLCLVFPSSSEKDRPAETIQELNKLLSAKVKGDPQVTVVDTWTLFANSAGNAKLEEFPDLLHPNKSGYAKWEAALRPIFATLGFLERELESFELEPGYESLFNGTDLSGWGFRPTTEKMLKGRKNWLSRDPENAPAWPIVTEAIVLDGKQVSEGGRYLAKNGRLVVTTPPEGRKIQQLWTTREFPGNFKLILEFRATPNADSGVFIREPQLQCRDFVLAGPYKDLKSYRPQQWNQLTITVTDGVAHCTCNGEVIEESLKVPDTGPIGLEGDRGQVEYRRIRISQLP